MGSSGQKLIKYTSSLAQQLGKVTPPKKMDVQSEQSLEWEIFEDRYQLNLVRGHAFCALLDFDHLKIMDFSALNKQLYVQKT